MNDQYSMLPLMISEDLPNATFSQELVDGVTPCGSRVGQKIDQSGQDLPHASRSAQQVQGLAAMTPDTSPPHFISLVGACRPRVLFGEQVASSAVFGKAASGTRNKPASTPEWAWLDDLQDRLEASRYAVGASDIPAAGVGGFHIRQRTFFGAIDGMGNAICVRRQSEPNVAGCDAKGMGQAGREPLKSSETGGNIVGLANPDSSGQPGSGIVGQPCNPAPEGDREVDRAFDACGGGRLADAAPSGRGEERADDRGGDCGDHSQGRAAGHGAGSGNSGADPHRSPWGDTDWLFCRDGKFRPVRSGTFPLAHGVSARVVRLRGYGNAIVPQAAAKFIEAFTEVIDSHLFA